MATITNELNKAVIYGDHRNTITVYGEHEAQPVGSEKGAVSITVKPLDYRDEDKALTVMLSPAEAKDLMLYLSDFLSRINYNKN